MLGLAVFSLVALSARVSSSKFGVDVAERDAIRESLQGG